MKLFTAVVLGLVATGVVAQTATPYLENDMPGAHEVWGSVFQSGPMSHTRFGSTVACNNENMCAVGMDSMTTTMDGMPNARVTVMARHHDAAGTRFDLMWTIDEPNTSPDSANTYTGFGSLMAWLTPHILAVYQEMAMEGPKVHLYSMEADGMHPIQTIPAPYMLSSITGSGPMMVLSGMQNTTVWTFEASSSPLTYEFAGAIHAPFALPNAALEWSNPTCFAAEAAFHLVRCVHPSAHAVTEWEVQHMGDGWETLFHMEFPLAPVPSGTDASSWIGREVLAAGPECFVTFDAELYASMGSAHVFCMPAGTSMFDHVQSVHTGLEMEFMTVVAATASHLVVFTRKEQHTPTLHYDQAFKTYDLHGQNEPVAVFPVPDDYEGAMDLMPSYRRAAVLGETLVLGNPSAPRDFDYHTMYAVGAVRYLETFLQNWRAPYYCHQNRMAHGVMLFGDHCFADDHCMPELHGHCDNRAPDYEWDGRPWFCRADATHMRPAPYGECPVEQEPITTP